MKIYGITMAAAATLLTLAAPAIAQDMHPGDHDMHQGSAMHNDDRNMHMDHDMRRDRGHSRWGNHRHCRMVWRHHHRIRRCW